MLMLFVLLSIIVYVSLCLQIISCYLFYCWCDVDNGLLLMMVMLLFWQNSDGNYIHSIPGFQV